MLSKYGILAVSLCLSPSFLAWTFPPGSYESNCHSKLLHRRLGVCRATLFPALVWAIWLHRYKVVFYTSPGSNILAVLRIQNAVNKALEWELFLGKPGKPGSNLTSIWWDGCCQLRGNSSSTRTDPLDCLRRLVLQHLYFYRNNKKGSIGRYLRKTDSTVILRM